MDSGGGVEVSCVCTLRGTVLVQGGNKFYKRTIYTDTFQLGETHGSVPELHPSTHLLFSLFLHFAPPPPFLPKSLPFLLPSPSLGPSPSPSLEQSPSAPLSLSLQPPFL